ncbi:unnamed protein product [Rotaria sp. Silwood1]|nr:unnamed protein product [Rotaria sp. Silwood1]CAF3667165.1 unnamed protein product [Rotaria sp. Silwood1]CAF4723263.1 unnamed protein product [Rotaria sp. Silwood1]
MYSQILKEILIEEPFDEEAKHKFVDFCHKYNAEYDIDLNVIDKFIDDYDLHSPIWWYTKEAFIYSMVNRALRTQNIEVIIKMGFFIRDLHRQIEQLHRDEMQSTEKTIVYRGQGLSHSEVEKLNSSKGGLLSFNNFLSTSTDRQVSYTFADSAGSNPDLIGILFRMEIDPTIRSSPFTSLDNVSYYGTSEKEILFSMHTVFRIGKIEQIEHHLWYVDLILTNDDDDEQLRQLTEQMRQITCGSTRLERLGALMIEMGESNKAQEMYETMLETACNTDVKENAELHHQLGYVFDQKGELDRALLHYRESFKLHLTFVSPDDPCMSTIYSNIGSVLHDLGKYDEALEHYQRALTVVAGESSEKDALFHNNIGTVLRDKGKYDEALKSYERALNIQLVCLSSLHPSLATTYGNIGQVYFSMGDNLIALSYYQKVLDIHKRSLPPEHPLVATCLNNMASIYYALEDYLTAILYYQKALNIMEKSESSHHPTLAVMYINIAMLFQLLGQNNEAIGHTAQAVDIASQVFGSDHPGTLKYKQYLNNLRNSF